jgi:hypothetical protein
MVYQMVSGKEVLARVDNNFDIDYSDWITKAPLWIADAMDEMQLRVAWEEAIASGNIEDKIILLPDDSPADIKHILGIEVNGVLLHRNNKINPVRQPSITTPYSSFESYTIKNGYIITSLSDSNTITTYRLFYERPQYDYDLLSQSYIPKVPINSVIQNAIVWYIIYCILRKGHKHPTYSLESKNPITNPFAMWQQEKKKAINEAGSIDAEERESLSKTMRTLNVYLNTPKKVWFTEDTIPPTADGIIIGGGTDSGTDEMY